RPHEMNRSGSVHPAIAESRVVLDAGETVVDVAELLADALDEGADVDAVAVLAIAGDEVLAAHQIVDLPVRHVGVVGIGEQPHDLEFGKRQVDALAVVEGAVDVVAQLELAADVGRGGIAGTVPGGRPLRPVGDEPQALQDDREAARLLDEVDRAPAQRCLLLDLMAEHCEEDHWNMQVAVAQVAQDREPSSPGMRQSSRTASALPPSPKCRRTDSPSPKSSTS